MRACHIVRAHARGVGLSGRRSGKARQEGRQSKCLNIQGLHRAATVGNQRRERAKHLHFSAGTSSSISITTTTSTWVDVKVRTHAARHGANVQVERVRMRDIGTGGRLLTPGEAKPLKVGLVRSPELLADARSLCSPIRSLHLHNTLGHYHTPPHAASPDFRTTPNPTWHFLPLPTTASRPPPRPHTTPTPLPRHFYRLPRRTRRSSTRMIWRIARSSRRTLPSLRLLLPRVGTRGGDLGVVWSVLAVGWRDVACGGRKHAGVRRGASCASPVTIERSNDDDEACRSCLPVWRRRRDGRRTKDGVSLPRVPHLPLPVRFPRLIARCAAQMVEVRLPYPPSHPCEVVQSNRLPPRPGTAVRSRASGS